MTILKIAQAVVAILLMIAILIQNRGTGLSGIFGGEGGVYRSRRGAEKNLFIITIVLSVLFFGLSLVGLIL